MRPASGKARDARRRGARWGIFPMLAAAPVEPMRVGGIITLVTAILAVQSVEAGLLPLKSAAPAPAPADPVLVRVGDAVVRVSDLRAQAGADAEAASADALVRQGYLDDATQQLALAEAAEADGLAGTLEVRAALALARRRVLSEAYLDLAVSRAVTDEAVRAAYEAEVAQTAAHDRVALRHVLTTTEEGANEARRRAERGERFASLAARLSQDDTTREAGGSFGMVHPDALPEGLRDVAQTAPLGALVGPIRTEDGWHLVRIDARRRMAMPSFEAREPAIREGLRAQAMRAAAARAEASLRIERERVPPASDPAGGLQPRVAADPTAPAPARDAPAPRGMR